MKASMIVFFSFMIWGCMIMLAEEPNVLYIGFIGWSILNIVFATKLEKKKVETEK